MMGRAERRAKNLPEVRRNLREGAELIGYHLRRALAQYAQGIGVQVDDLTPEQRNQAFYDYRRAGRQFEGAEEEGHEAE